MLKDHGKMFKKKRGGYAFSLDGLSSSWFYQIHLWVNADNPVVGGTVSCAKLYLFQRGDVVIGKPADLILNFGTEDDQRTTVDWRAFKRGVDQEQDQEEQEQGD